MMPIPSRIYNAAVGGHVAGADQIIDDETGLTLDKVAGGALEEKEYTSGSNNGMGRVVLRKNLVNGINTLTQTMINKSNTIYVIQYDFTLGENITIPANCVLEFAGGSVSGKPLYTNNATIIGNIGNSNLIGVQKNVDFTQDIFGNKLNPYATCEFAFFQKDVNFDGLNSLQSIIASNNYIYIFGHNTNSTKGYILKFDYNYNYLGGVESNLVFLSGGVMKGLYIYIGVSGNKIVKFTEQDIADSISENIDINYSVVNFDGYVGNISGIYYDERTEYFLVYGSSHCALFDASFNLIIQNDIVLDSPHNIQYQGRIFKNGSVIFY